ncbi:MAG: hypothetical protein RL148_197 [Planctomycetota bacterium]
MRRTPQALVLLALLGAAFAVWALGGDESGVQPADPTRPAEAAPDDDTRPEVQPGGAAAPEASQRIDIPAVESGRNLPQGVRGRVVDGTGRPVVGVRALLVEAPDDNLSTLWLAMQHGVPVLPTAESLTDATGHFALGLRQPSSRGHLVRVVSAAHADGRSGVLRIQPEEWLDLGDLALTEGVVLRGRVTIEGTQVAVPNALVTLRSGVPFEDLQLAAVAGREQGLSARTDAAGRYEIPHVPGEGQVSLAAAAPGFARIVRTGIELSAKEAHQVDFALPRGMTVSGRVLDASGPPVAEARVLAWPHHNDGGEPFEAFSDQDGRFELIGLREGPHRLRVLAADHQPMDLAQVLAGESQLAVSLERRLQVLARVTAPGAAAPRQYALGVRRWFPDHGGQVGAVQGVPDQFIRTEDLAGGPAAVRGLVPGTYVLQVEAAGWARTLSEPFTLEPGSQPLAVDVRLTAGGTVTGQVVDSAGRPVQGVTVATETPGAGENNPLARILSGITPERVTRATVTTDAQGNFRLERLAFATYQLRIGHPDHCEALVGNLLVADTAQQVLPAVTLRRGALVQGRALLQGVPAAQVRVTVAPVDGPGAQAPESALVRIETVSAANGSFVFARRLPPGNYELRAAQLAGNDGQSDVFRVLMQLRASATRITVRPGEEAVVADVLIPTDH